MSQTSATEVSDELAELLRPLEGLDERPLGEHAAAYEQVHATLRQVLAGEPPAAG